MDGWAEHDWNQERYFEWGKTPADAMDKVRAKLHLRRTDPHYAHIVDLCFLPDCQDCQKDWVNLEMGGELVREESYA